MDHSQYQILFTSDSFEPDFPATPESEKDEQLYRTSPWKAVYDLGFAPPDAQEHVPPIVVQKGHKRLKGRKGQTVKVYNRASMMADAILLVVS